MSDDSSYRQSGGIPWEEMRLTQSPFEITMTQMNDNILRHIVFLAIKNVSGEKCRGHKQE